MTKIVWKSFKYNIKNFYAFFLSAILSVAMLFAFMYIKELSKTITFEHITSASGFLLEKTFPVIIIASILVMVYSIKFYVRTRIKDYTMLLILGIRKKTFAFFIAVEYSFSWLLSIAIGLVCGNIIVLVFKKVLEIAANKVVYSSIDVLQIYKLTLLWCLVMFAGVIIALFVFLTEKDISKLLQAESLKEKQKVSKLSRFMFMAGIVLIVLSIMIAFKTTQLDNNTGSMAIFICAAGIFLILKFGVTILLEELKQHHRYYFKNILLLNSFYYRFNNNMIMIFVQSVIGIFLLYFIWITMTMGWNVNEKNYPYDVICKTSVSEAKDLRKLCDEFSQNISEFPIAEVYYYSIPEIGIAEKTYKSLWGKDFDLKEKEIFYSRFVNSARYDLNEQPGEETRIFIDIKSFVDYKFETYELKGTNQGLLFGASMRDVIVFSDEEFENIIKEYKPKGIMIVFNIQDKKTEQVTAKLREYEKQKKDTTVYIKKTILNAEQLENIIRLAVVSFMVLFILLYLFFIIGLKFFSDLPKMKEKYLFLDTMGMPVKDRKQMIKKEVSNFLMPPLLISCIFGGCICTGLTYISAEMYNIPLSLSANVDIPSMMWVLPQIIGFIILYMVFIFALKKIMVKSILR